MTLETFINSEAGLALKGALIVAFADFATGSFAALRDRTFQFDAIAAFLRKHVLGRVLPLGTLLGLGYFGGAAGTPFLPFAIAGLAAYAAETAASIMKNLAPATKVAGVPAEASNPVPEE